MKIEFVSGEGATIAVETLSLTDKVRTGGFSEERTANIRPVGAREILHARPLESA